MDPVGPWFTPYNRLTAGATAGTYQAGGTTNSEFVPPHLGTTTGSQNIPSTTASPILLQPAHTTASLAGQSPFNPGGFLSPPPAGYDVFSPLFHHPNQKQAHYAVPHRQPIVQPQSTPVPTKQSTTASEPEVTSIRENYNATHQSTFFEHQSHATTPATSSLPWNHQNNSQLSSPFGILPHESVVPSSPGPPPPPPPPSKSGGNSAYENNFNTHFAPGHNLNNINSPLPTSAITTDFKSTTYSEDKKVTRTVSPSTIKSTVSATSAGNDSTFFQQASTPFGSDALQNNYPVGNTNIPSKVPGSLMHQQSCIVSTPNNNAIKDYRIPQSPAIRSSAPTAIFSNSTGRSVLTQSQDKNVTVPNFPPSNVKTPQANTQQIVQTKAQTKVYPELGNHDLQRIEPGHENSQSSPISYSIMDARTLNYPTNTASNCNNNTTGKHTTNQRTPPNNNLQQTQQQFHALNQQQQASQQQTQQQTTPYRHYVNTSSESEYHHSGRSKSAASTDSAYSSNTSTQNGPDCGVVVPRRPSPLQAHSQASPLGHVPSPAYPMYNSPMATMSSPSPLQQHADNNGNTSQCNNAQTYKTVVQQQVTPPSPLDVSVPRPASQGQVAYSSVITRVLGTSENNKTNYTAENPNYERQQDFTQRQKQQQICWDNDNRQSIGGGGGGRKFPVAYTPNNADMNSQTIPNHQQQSHRVLNVADRQQGYFDSSQVPLQDLSSCRGDPMNPMKNLQQSSSSCQIQQQQSGANLPPTTINETQKQFDARHRKNDPNKKRRNYEKNSGHLGSTLNDTTGSTMMTDYFNRIPPPAHHNSNQQSQNGYFDFDRWNLAAPPTSKMFTGSPGSFGAQSPIHHSNNFIGNSAHQHQSLMVLHHHAPPPIPYFSPFHLPPGHHPSHHPTEYQSSVDMAQMGYGENSMPVQNSGYQDYRDDQPKVIVPNIEEELGFLQQNQFPINNNNNNTNLINRDIKPSCREPNSGFMTSYLKFLQGDREPSPPPAMRGGRKTTWNRSKPYAPLEPIKSNDVSTNGGIIKGPNLTKETPTIDYANDPRYFPLPKERKKPYIDSSDDGITSDDDFPFSTRKHEKKQQNNFTPAPTVENIVAKPEVKPKKGRPIKPGGPTDRKRKAAAAAAAAAAADLAAGRTPQKPEQVPVILPPRRETSKRKAKEKVPAKQFVDNSDDEEQGDSDSDPAWTPAAKLMGDEEEKKKKRGRPVISKRTKKILDDDDYSSAEVVPRRGRKKLDSKNSSSKLANRIDEKLLASVSDEDIDISPFKSGEFVVIKSELDEEYPALWRIDGKTLLQKYEPFNSNGRKLYRNISTYSGWTPQNRHLYQQVPVRFWQQGKLETIVEFLRDEMIIDDRECITKSIKDNEKYQDSFEVYIQTLISQALDSNFLTEIFQEKDDYFLLNVKTVDEITEERKRRLLSTTKWQANVVTAISTWPCLNVLKDLPNAECKGKQCVGCNRNKIYARVLLYGQPYNATTLEGSPPDPRVPHDKDFLLCRVCQTKVALFNKVAHQKYLMFLECARRVADKRSADPNKDTTIILNELLADEVWLNQLFKEVRNIWAEIDSIEHQAKVKENANFNILNEKQDYNSCISNVPSNIDTHVSTDGMINNCLPTNTSDSLSASVSS